MSTLYLVEQGSKLRKVSKRLVVEKDSMTILEVPAHEVERVLIFGAVQISTQALSFLLDSGIDVSFLSLSGRLKGRLLPAESKNVFLRLAQFERHKDMGFRLKLARSIIQAKMKNQKTLLLRYQRNHPEVDFSREIKTISDSLSLLPYQKSIPSLMGLEGTGTSSYFQCFSRMISPLFSFEKREKHPPPDPVNALLSLGYVILTNEIASLVESVGFDPFVGFLHGLRYGRQSLPLDLVEEFRHPVVDTLVLTLVKKRRIRESDFYSEPEGTFLLKREAFEKFLVSYEDRLEKSFLYKEEGLYTTYRKLLRHQVGMMEKAVFNKAEYKPFLVQ
jgi:CRISPR-associated protein Cas1